MTSCMVLLAQDYAQDPVPDPKRPDITSLSAAEVMARSLQKYRDNLAAQRNYLYEKRQVQRELDMDGKLKKTEIRTYEISMPCGDWYERLVAKNDQPLSDKDSKKENEKLDKHCAKQVEKQKKNPRLLPGVNTRGDAAPPPLDERNRREQEFAAEIAGAYLFHFEPEEQIEGRRVWVIRATPNPAFKARNLTGKLLKKMTGKVWIDESNYQWVESEADLLDDFFAGWFLFKLYKGTHLEFAQTRVNDETWLPKRVYIRAAARIAVKSARYEMEMLFSNYRKFRVDSEVKGFAEPTAPRQ